MHHLVTGGAGFIGSHLCEALVAAGHTVTALDDLSTGRRGNLAALEGRAGFTLVEGTVLDPATVARAAHGAQVIVHLAATVGVRLVIDRPVETLVNNVRGTEVVLEAASRLGVRTLVASTSEVYGKLMSGASPQTALREDDDILIGRTGVRRWGYACSKALDEFLALAHATEHGLPVTVIRFFNTVGPRQLGEYGMVLPRFAEAALAGAPIRVHGDGSQTRCFTYVDDTVDGTVRAATMDAALGSVFNVGNDSEITVADLAALVKRVTGSESDVVSVSYESRYGARFEDTKRRVPDLSRASSVLGYRPSVALEDGLRRTLEWWRQEHR